MRKLSDSAIFTKLIRNNELIAKMKAITTSNSIKTLSINDLPNEFNSIERRINYATKGQVMDKYMKGNIKLIDEPTFKLPSYITTVPGMGINGDVCVYCNLNRYRSRSGEIYPKKLFAIMQNALINYELLKNWSKYTNNLELMKQSSFIYSRIVTKVLDKVFALDLNEFNSDFMSYIFAKFFLVNMCERNNNELNTQIAYKCCFNNSSLKLIEEFEMELADTKFDSFFDLIESLQVVAAIKTINIRTFVENFVRMYGEGALLFLDYLPSFYQVIFSATIGGDLVKDYMFESVCGNMNLKTFTTFSKLIG